MLPREVSSQPSSFDDCTPCKGALRSGVEMAKTDGKQDSKIPTPSSSHSLRVTWRGVRPEIAATGIGGIIGAVIIVIILIGAALAVPALGLSHVNFH